MHYEYSLSIKAVKSLSFPLLWLNVNLLQGPMITRRIPALLLALSPFWVSASVYAEEVIQVDPVTAIDEKMTTKQTEIDAISAEYEAEGAKLQQLKNEHVRIKRESEELDAKRNRAKSALDKQYSRLLDDPDTDLASFQKKYQETWASVKQNQAEGLENNQAMTEV
ncbi:chromosome partitioning protein ParA, partial [Vibrio anguillarum]|nr:chromosome partitioning protein ParA [Vibrio anguillarum]